jgi:hypothetical protein
VAKAGPQMQVTALDRQYGVLGDAIFGRFICVLF